MGGVFGDVVFAVVDVETTGIRPTQDRIIEVAVIDVDAAGSELRRWSTLVRPTDRPLDGRLTAVVDAPTFAEIAGELCQRLSGGVVCGHNVKFDLRMIDAELGRIDAHLPELSFFDTHAVATKLNVDTPNRSLAVLCDALDVPFGTWHTAESDTEATAALLTKLLERAAGWGRTDLGDLCGTWYGIADQWPTLAAGGRTLRRDPVTFPPSGRQPGQASTFKPSWRRHGTGEKPYTPNSDHSLSYTIDLADYDDVITASTIAAVNELVDEHPPGVDWPEWWPPEWAQAADYVAAGADDTGEAALFLGTALVAYDAEQRSAGPAGEARSDWYAGDFQAEGGIERLQNILAALDASDEDDVNIMIEASGVLADLFIRHGGRPVDVVAAYTSGLELAVRAAAAPPPEVDEDGWMFDPVEGPTTDLVQDWWKYTASTRDVQALKALYETLTGSPIRMDSYTRPAVLAAESVRSYVAAGELAVATDLYKYVIAATDRDAAGCASACERLANAYAVAGHTDEAVALCEQAWAESFADQNVANRHSLILERAGEHELAAQVAERGLLLPQMGSNDALSKRMARCRRRLAFK